MHSGRFWVIGYFAPALHSNIDKMNNMCAFVFMPQVWDSPTWSQEAQYHKQMLTFLTTAITKDLFIATAFSAHLLAWLLVVRPGIIVVHELKELLGRQGPVPVQLGHFFTDVLLMTRSLP